MSYRRTAIEVEILMHVCLAGAKSCPPRIGGIETFTYEVGKRLASKGFKVTVIVPRRKGESRTELVDGMDTRRILAIHNRYTLKISMIPGLLKCATKASPDIFHANDPPSGLVSALGTRWRSSILTVHGIGFAPSEWPSPFRQAGRFLQAIAVEGASEVVATDEQTALGLRRYKGDVHVIPPGVDTNLFRRGEHQRPDSLDGKKINVLFAGRLTYVKGFDLLLRCLEHLAPSTLSRISITIIGDGPLAGQVGQLKLPTNLVNWIGELPHEKMPPYFAHADLLVVPSRSEGVPISMLEAMSASLPVVSTMVGGIMTHFDERHLTKIESPTAQGLATAIERAIGDEQSLRRKATEARELVTSRFSWDTIVEEYIRLYDTALGL